MDDDCFLFENQKMIRREVERAAFTSSPATHSDLFQTVCTKAWQAKDTYRGGSLAGWLRTIVRNVVQDHGRHKNALKRSGTERAPCDELFVDTRHRRAADRVDIADALKHLTESERLLIELRFFDGRTLKEIELLLGESRFAIARQIRKSLTRLRRLLDEEAQS